MSAKSELLKARALLARWAVTCGQDVWRPTRQITQETKDFLMEEPQYAASTRRDSAEPVSEDVPTGLLTAKQLLALRAVHAADQQGLTSSEAEAALHDRHQSVSARLYELRHAGLIEWGGLTRRTPSGRPAKVHTVTARGRAFLNNR